ncbi:MAG TPA: tRNA (guanosine(37)-N1)-methyltransferase TrmD [Candidatus Paceibacterota bacterium]|nr:tRNA (guanosine(37)-N1)-methyltransferase TrmD [Candidatus Paceibacterota bacterium]
MLRFHLITLFPEACDAYLSASILGRARDSKKISVSYQNPRDFVPVPKGKDKAFAYKKVDERPYGGGPGMVMTALPIVKAVKKSLGRRTGKKAIIWFSPSGKQFTNKDADALGKLDEVVFVCGRYEGIDERAMKILKTMAPVKVFAFGEAVYTGGEVPAMGMVDAITRRLPGVLGKDASVEERRVAAPDVYTRPEVLEWEGRRYKVPAVLLTGNHANIDAERSKKRKGSTK